MEIDDMVLSFRGDGTLDFLVARGKEVSKEAH